QIDAHRDKNIWVVKMESSEGSIVEDFLGFLVLMQLSESPLTSFGIIARIHEKHLILIGPGVVYSILAELEGDDLIESSPKGGRKKIYSITEKGRDALKKRLTPHKGGGNSHLLGGEDG
ncbi:MAG: PadR family transcriptional regulator, partial [Candidatus Geothermarchaeales archaeon]